MPSTFAKSLVWFRRDLRDYDHAALYQALKRSDSVFAVFVFDTDILDALPRSDRRVEFIHASVAELKQAFQSRGGELLVRHGQATDIIPRLARELQVDAVFANHDYEPAAIERDRTVGDSLRADAIDFLSFKDHVVFEKAEILTKAGGFYTVFTPYSRAWKAKLDDFYLSAYPVGRYWSNLARRQPEPMPLLSQIGFTATDLADLGIQAGMSGAQARWQDFVQRMDRYHERRDFPFLKGPSYLSVHLRFGTISIREIAAFAFHDASPGAQVWLNELVWRDFYAQILANFPTVVGRSFREEFAGLPFPNLPELFAAWREGRTGYPLVDAAMRQLNKTGYMHNRLRMIAASFLVKDLLIDWRWGERYFAEKLLDYDLASNNGGWQWAASTGCDAQPYFRIFNPVTQSERFDSEGCFIRRYLPELAPVPQRFIHAPWNMPPSVQQSCGVLIGRDYPAPVVDHAQAREQALTLYGKAR